MSEIIDPRQEAKGKKKEHHSQQLEESPPWACQDLPTLEELHKETGQNSKLGSCRANLQKKSITDNVRLMPPAWPLQPASGISYFFLNSSLSGSWERDSAACNFIHKWGARSKGAWLDLGSRCEARTDFILKRADLVHIARGQSSPPLKAISWLPPPTM